ncbi:MAG: hypothetical protein KGR24_03350 [Planctomycetes bacterium]|nr:hypothetical protein [Planctomycetota bacterium]
MDPRQSVRRGDPITLAAEQVNGLNRLLNNRGGFGGPSDVVEPLPYTWVYCKNPNGTGQAQEAGNWSRWDAIAITGIEIAVTSRAGLSQFETMPVVVGGTAGRSHLAEPATRLWGVLVEPVRAGQIGRLAIGGVVQSKIRVVNEADRFVATDGQQNTIQNQLRSSSSGEGLILWKESGTGANKWALIRLGTSREIIRVTFTAPWTKGTTLNVADAVSGQSYSAYNWFATIGGTGSRNGAIAFVGDRWALIAAEC